MFFGLFETLEEKATRIARESAIRDETARFRSGLLICICLFFIVLFGLKARLFFNEETEAWKRRQESEQRIKEMISTMPDKHFKD